ncbi:MAG: BspA family leucine-rich repeat surface protein [Lactobacillus sp.]|uniref:BspA family leucine-rich repeat surface protein n=1 Tax=Bombilactobacillus bombi TaxID=1303590 RepID=UPI0035EB1F61|nr:BspA family leucine-rich repeat surface protein [Lactobacillus sp.]
MKNWTIVFYGLMVTWGCLFGPTSCIQASSNSTSLKSQLAQDNSWWEIDKNHVLTIHSCQINLDAQKEKDWPWHNQAAQITKIIIEPEVTAQKSLHEMFAYMPKLEKIEGLENLDTAEVTDLGGLFKDDTHLQTIDINSFDTKKVVDMTFMFDNCQAITRLNLANLAIPETSDTGGMFRNMTNLWQLTLGAQIVFTKDPLLPPAPGDDRRLPIGDNYNHTSRWQEVGTGQPENPQGKWRTAANIYKLYDPSAQRDSRTFVWDQAWWNFNSQTHTLTLYQKELESTATDNNYWPWQAQHHQAIQTVVIKPKVKIKGSLRALFFGLTEVKRYFGLENLDTSQATDMSNMFYDNASLTQLDVSTFQTANVENFSEMFSLCSQLQTLNVSNFNTSKATNMLKMFDIMPQLQTLDLSTWDMRQVQNTDKMLMNTNSLWQLTLGAQTRFPNNPGIGAVPIQQVIPSHPNFESEGPLWQAVAQGLPLQPLGPHLTNDEIWSQYQNSNAFAQTYVWTSKPLGYLTLATVPPQLDFGRQIIPTSEHSYYTATDQCFEVWDTRVEREKEPSWQLLAFASPLVQTDNSQHQILDTFRYQGQIFNQQQPVILHQQQSQAAQSKYTWSYPPQAGIILNIQPQTIPQSGSYQAIITYELQNSL